MTASTIWCLRLRRRGQPIPRWQQSQERWHEGMLRVQQEADRLLGRSVMVARLSAATRGDDLIPPLFDAHLVQLLGDRIVLSGLERDDLTRTDTAQTWLVIAGREVPGGAGQPSG